MTDAQKIERIKELTSELKKIHSNYMDKFSKLHKMQLALLKQVRTRVETLKISELRGVINKKSK